MKAGDVIRTTYFQHHQGGASMSYKASKGKVFVAVLLGVENKDGSEPINLKDAFNALGWVPEPGVWSEKALRALEGAPEK